MRSAGLGRKQFISEELYSSVILSWVFDIARGAVLRKERINLDQEVGSAAKSSQPDVDRL